jgi:membrane protein DedA with SNARE-associated domain
MLEIILEWIAEQVVAIGYPAILLLMVLEHLVLFVPSEVILPFFGYLVSIGHFNYFSAVFVATLGSILGSVIIYETSRAKGRAFIRTYGRYVLLDEKHLDWSEGWFLRFGEKAIFFSRLIPGVRQLISIPAGTTKMDRARFLGYTLAGSLLWNSLFIGLGWVLGKEWHRVGAYMQPIDILAIGIIVGIAAWLIFRWLEEHTIIGEVRPRIVEGSRDFVQGSRKFVRKSRRMVRKLRKRGRGPKE